MKVFQVVYDYCPPDTKEVTKEISYQIGCWITVCESAIRHAEEYEKDLVSITDILTITQQHKAGVYYYPEDEE